MDLTLKRAPGIYLTGFMGSGKTTVARSAGGASRLGFHRCGRRYRSAGNMRP